MTIEISIPSPGESISEVELASWLVEDGDYVTRDQEIAEIESDKATLPLMAEKSGKVKILVEAGSTIKVGTVACTIDTDAEAPAGEESKGGSTEEKDDAGKKDQETEDQKKEESSKTEPKSKSSAKEEPAKKKDAKPDPKADSAKESTKDGTYDQVKVTPLARNVMEEEKIDVEDIIKGLRKLSSKDVYRVLESRGRIDPSAEREGSREEKHEEMSQLRRKLSKRLVAVKNETAMLTTFNEVDMSAVIALRKKYQNQFVEKHGVKLGFMSFFTKAVTEALHVFPKVNSRIEGDDIVTPEYVDIAIAVQTDKGLMVPVIRNTETLSLADIEHKIIELAGKARKFRLSIEEMTGGSFTITNGGIFGSMLSTPIINPPQSGILGMHNIVERPVAVNGKVEIRPIMYIALSYDHRVIDGRDSVSFLVKVKELIEAPHKLLFGGKDPENILLDL